jgi:hypothetical protein
MSARTSNSPSQQRRWTGRVLGVTVGVCTSFMLACSGETTGPGPGPGPDVSDTTGTPETPAVVINVRAQPVPALDGGSCLTFFAVPEANVVLISVTIKNPLNNQAAFTFGSPPRTVAANETVPLQDVGKCYIQVSGPYNFIFTGNRPGGGEITSTAIYNQP